MRTDPKNTLRHVPAGTLGATEATATCAASRVLVADDNPVNQMVAVKMLEKLGCRASLASDGAAAVRMHAEHHYDLILMDCQMPNVDGYEATARIRQSDGPHRHTPIVALTSSTLPAEREKCQASGMDDFLAKPVDVQLLKAVLERWLQQAPAVNKDRLDAMLDAFGDAEFAALVELYQSDAPKRIEAMRIAYANNDAVELARVSHAFSGSCASIGAATLCSMCKEIESLAKTGTLNDIERRLTTMAAEYERVNTQLRTRLAAL
jgi:CheY-like chemotaxis protein/HPt (histidine-containing phosphotransfer) domain-containing protein